MFLKKRIRKHEIGLWFRYGDFERVLQPGVYSTVESLWDPNRVRIEVYDRLKTRFEHSLLDLLVEDEELRDELLVVDLAEEERGLLWKEGRLSSVLGRGRHAFWREPYQLEVERFSVRDFRFQHPKLEAILGRSATAEYLESVRVRTYERVLLFLEGQLLEVLEPGLHGFWKQAGKTEFWAVDLREQVAEVAGQEIMTADKVTLRVNLLVTYKVTEPTLAATEVTDYRETVYREAQLALRAAVGTRRIDQLLADKRAEANLIRRREETAAVRSQVNTARLMAENPELVRMKELEGLQEILSGAKTTFIFGSGDLTAQLRSLLAEKVEE